MQKNSLLVIPESFFFFGSGLLYIPKSLIDRVVITLFCYKSGNTSDGAHPTLFIMRLDVQ